MRRRLLVIYNSLAGVKRHRMLERASTALSEAGAILTLEHAGSLEEDERIAREAAASGSYDAVVAAGGDSTVRGVAAGLAGTGTPLGVIPAGTGNVLAEEIGLTRAPDAVAHTIVHGPAIEVRGGSLAGHTFYEMAGAGFDARVLARLHIGLKQRVGKPAYAWPILAELAKQQPRFAVEVDGRAMRCTWMIVTNVSRYAGGFLLTPRQSIASPGFHAVVIDAPTHSALLGVLLALAAGRIASHPAVSVLPCRSARILGAHRIPLQVDGEPLHIDDARDIEITEAGASLHLIVPSRTSAQFP